MVPLTSAEPGKPADGSTKPPDARQTILLVEDEPNVPPRRPPAAESTSATR